MKKKDKDLNRVSIFYDKDLWIVTLILLPVIVGGIILVWDEPFFESRNTMWLKIFPFIEVFLILCSLKRRTIDSEGVSKSYLGIKYKRISWEDMDQYSVEYMKHKYYKDKPGYYKYMLVFKSKFFYGRTIITMDATDEARALAEKYFGPPASIPNVVSVDQDKK